MNKISRKVVTKIHKIRREEVKKIREEMKKTKDVKGYRRLEAVALRGEGKSRIEISKIVGIHPDVVGRWVKRYLNEGEKGLKEERRKGGNNQNITEAEIKEFLTGFEESAKKGQIITVGEIATSYDKRVGKEHKSRSCQVVCVN